ncbi:ig-like domain-containing protein [Caerostris extrusa]|uniref:Ig-like domain-containing protein n=1 Tax=Caerostris extrusa TaxID=172846 RepID=A0AAV4T8Y4_CAEEX|nr:ig-like domain-containing protein [Caerostris extrusa]
MVEEIPVKKVTIQAVTMGHFPDPFTVVFTERRPTVTWQKGTRLLQGSVSVDDHGVVRNELYFNRLRREDLLTVLTCRASNNNVSAPVYATVSLDLNQYWKACREGDNGGFRDHYCHSPKQIPHL